MLTHRYMQHINPLIATLEPQREFRSIWCRAPATHVPYTLTPHTPVHTLAWVRSSSPILLSAMMTVASKFFRRPLYRSLLAHTNTIVNRAVGMGHCDIGLVQALIIMVCWKDPTDGSSWVKLGIAIRLGYQLGLHVLRTQPLPANEFEARIVANAERTWYTVSCECCSQAKRKRNGADILQRLIDCEVIRFQPPANLCRYSDVYGLPPTVRLEEIPDAVRWAEETAWLGCGDMRHACSFSSASTYRMWVKYRRNLHTMSRDLAWAILDDLYAQIDQHMNHWFPADPCECFSLYLSCESRLTDSATGMITTFEQTYLKWFDLNHLLKIKYHMLDICAPHERDAAVLDWLLLAESFAKQTEALGLLGTLRYFQDTSATHISSFGVMVYNVSTMGSCWPLLFEWHLTLHPAFLAAAELPKAPRHGTCQAPVQVLRQCHARRWRDGHGIRGAVHAASAARSAEQPGGGTCCPPRRRPRPRVWIWVGPGKCPCSAARRPRRRSWWRPTWPGHAARHALAAAGPGARVWRDSRSREWQLRHKLTWCQDGFFRAMLQNGQNALQDLVTTDNQFWFDPNMPLP